MPDQLTPAGRVLDAMQAALANAEDLALALRSAMRAAYNLDESHTELAVMRLYDQAVRLHKEAEVVTAQIAIDYPETPDRSAADDARYHEAKEDGRLP